MRDSSDAGTTSGSISPIKMGCRDLRHSRIARFEPPAVHDRSSLRLVRWMAVEFAPQKVRVNAAAMPPFAAV
jgi:hypothetical protein